MGTILKMNNVYKNVQSVQNQKPPKTPNHKNVNTQHYFLIIPLSLPSLFLVSLVLIPLSTTL